MRKINPTFVIIEFGVADGAVTPVNVNAVLDEHTAQVFGVIKRWRKQNFRVVSLPDTLDSVRWIRDNIEHIFVISASVTDFDYSYMYQEFKDKIYMATSAGNTGDTENTSESDLARTDFFTAIGAVDDKLKLEPYSSYGKGAVEFVGITPRNSTKYKFKGKTKRKRLKGTSFACPQHATQVMDLMVDYYNRTGERLPIKEVLRVRNKYTKDVLEKGIDLKSGRGIYTYSPEHILNELDYINLKKYFFEELEKAKKEIYDSVKIEKKPTVIHHSNEIIYNHLDEVPEWAYPTIKLLVNKGILKGGKSGLGLNTLFIRILVILDRVGVFDKFKKIGRN